MCDPAKQCQNNRRGIVFDVQRCSFHDGPGIRTTVFLKGCPLRCVWCHNPEAFSFEPQWMDGASSGEQGKVLGYEMDVEEILRVLELDRPYFETSGGGLTISGGEPMSQLPFTLALLQGSKAAGFHTCLDTSGEAPWDHYAAVLPFVDVYHYDYKATGAETHRTLTGSNGERILDNLDRLVKNGARIILRCPMIPGVNDSEEHFLAIARIAATVADIQVDLLPYHDLARNKRRRLHMPEVSIQTHVPTPEELRNWRHLLEIAGVREEQLIGAVADAAAAA